MNDFSKYPEFERDPEYIVGKDVTFMFSADSDEELQSFDYYQRHAKVDLTVHRFDPWTGLHDVRLTADDPNQDDKRHTGLILVCVDTGWIAIPI